MFRTIIQNSHTVLHIVSCIGPRLYAKFVLQMVRDVESSGFGDKDFLAGLKRVRPPQTDIRVFFFCSCHLLKENVLQARNLCEKRQKLVKML